MSRPVPIILDCDPGHDDAIALLLAVASPEVELLAVTTVHGNQTLAKTTANALRVSDAYACVRVLADSISSLPLHVYRRTTAGRLPAGDASRAVQLLNRPAPGSTRAATSAWRSDGWRPLAPTPRATS